MNALSKINIRILNEKLQYLERMFIVPKGLPQHPLNRYLGIEILFWKNSVFFLNITVRKISYLKSLNVHEIPGIYLTRRFQFTNICTKNFFEIRDFTYLSFKACCVFTIGNKCLRWIGVFWCFRRFDEY